MLPHRPFSVISLIFMWFFGLCYGFVLLSSAAGHNGDLKLLDPGELVTYDWESVVRFNEKDNKSKNAGFFISGSVDVATVWEKDDSKIVKFKISSPNLHVKSRKSPTPEGFIQHSSKLDQFKNSPFYIIWNNGKIEKILLAKGEQVSLANIKKGLASLFQIQFLDRELSETDSSGKCMASYTTLSPTKTLKYKKDCISEDLKYQRNIDEILGVETVSSRMTEYELDQTFSYLKSVISKESHTVFVKTKEELGNIIEAEQKLNFVKKGKVDTIVAGNIQDAFEQIYKKERNTFTQESLLTEKEEDHEDHPKLTKEIGVLRESLQSEHLGTLKSTKSFLRLVNVARNARKEDLIKVLEHKKNQNLLPQLYDILGYVQTKNSHEAAMKNLLIDDENHLDLIERYLWSLSMHSNPNYEIVENLLNKFNYHPNIPEKVKESLILTLASMARRLRITGSSLKTAATVQETILDNLDYVKSEEKYKFLRALKNLRHESTIPILLKYIQTGTLKEGVLAYKALKSLDTIHFNEEVLKIAYNTFLQLYKKHDSSSRTIAIDILLETNSNDIILDSLLNFLNRNETNFEIKQYTLQRIRMKADTDNHFRQRVENIIRKNSKLNNYSALAPRGLSTALRRDFFRSKSANGSLVSIQEINSGIAKRGMVNVVLEKNGVSLELFSLGIFSGGLNSFLSSDSDSEGEEDSPTAGMELTVLGTQIRPFVFFSSSGELMGHVWSGTASERTPAFQANIMLIDHLEYLRLGNGFIVELDIKGAVSFDLSGKIEISLWNRNSQGLVEKSAGILVLGRTKIDSELIKLELEFTASVEPKLSLSFDADFAGDVKMCMKLTQPDSIYRHNIFKIERVPGSKHQLRISKYMKNTVPGKTYNLNRKNNEMCNAIFS